MTIQNEHNQSPNLYARITGILLLIMTFAGPFSMMYVPTTLIIPGDPTATANNIFAHETLFRAGILGHLLVLFTDLGVALLLYVLFRPVSKTVSLIAASFRLVMVAMRGINLVCYFLALRLINGGEYFSSFNPEQLHALALLFLNGFNDGVVLDLIFFSLHLFFLGYLVYKSTFMPRIIGIFLVISGFGYLLNNIVLILSPDTHLSIVMFTFWGELVLAFWLLIKGVKVEKWNELAK